ncbi:MAG: hypothetical protein Q8Q06_00525 [bacterium]|nr:hypothetical protein [bacterium]
MRLAKWVPIINVFFFACLAISSVYYFQDINNREYIQRGVQVVFFASLLLMVVNVVFILFCSDLYETAGPATKIRAVAARYRANGDVVVYGFVDNDYPVVRVIKGPKTKKLHERLKLLQRPTEFEEICLMEAQIVNDEVVPSRTIICLDLK